ncbi:hypothetical protein CHUAL_005263 [Chamberlinius hualienensis]
MVCSNQCNFSRYTDVRFYCNSCDGTLKTFLSNCHPSTYTTRERKKNFVILNPNVSIEHFISIGGLYNLNAEYVNNIRRNLQIYTHHNLLDIAKNTGILGGSWKIDYYDDITLNRYWQNLAKTFYSRRDLKYFYLQCHFRSGGGGQISIANEDFRDVDTVEKMAELIRNVLRQGDFDSESAMFFYKPNFYSKIKISRRLIKGRTDLHCYIYYSYVHLLSSLQGLNEACEDVVNWLRKNDIDFSVYL